MTRIFGPGKRRERNKRDKQRTKQGLKESRKVLNLRRDRNKKKYIPGNRPEKRGRERKREIKSETEKEMKKKNQIEVTPVACCA